MRYSNTISWRSRQSNELFLVSKCQISHSEIRLHWIEVKKPRNRAVHVGLLDKEKKNTKTYIVRISEDNKRSSCDSGRSWWTSVNLTSFPDCAVESLSPVNKSHLLVWDLDGRFCCFLPRLVKYVESWRHKVMTSLFPAACSRISCLSCL